MRGTLQVTSVEIKEGYMPLEYQGDPNRYNSSRAVSHSYESKTLFIEGTIEGKEVVFFSPPAIISKAFGMINYISLDKPSKWFHIKNGENLVHEGDPQFDNGVNPNIAIENTATLEQSVHVGDSIEISYCIKRSNKNNLFIERVRILNNEQV